MLTVSYWMDQRAPNGGPRESTQGAKGIFNPIGGPQYELTSIPSEPLSLAAYISEDGLVGHQWRGPLVVQILYASVKGNARAKRWEWVWGTFGIALEM